METDVKAVITAAGLGTRLLPMTKELPKEMLPIFVGEGGRARFKPTLQAVFEQLYEVGFREFCFVVGRGKRAIEDHFTPDYSFVRDMLEAGKEDVAEDLKRFYDKVESSVLIWINQPKPAGFGDAVLKAKSFVGDGTFLVHAGDTYVASEGGNHLKELLRCHQEFKADATLLVHEVEDPRPYGIIVGNEVSKSVYKVDEAVEKPEKPATNIAILPIYLFESAILDALKRTPPGKGGELQLTDGIQKMIEAGHAVYALKSESARLRLDIGMPEAYLEGLRLSYEQASLK